MLSIINYTKLAQIPLFLANIGFGIYTVIILSTNSREIISDEVYAFVVSICIINFVRSLSNINKLIQINDENCCISKIIPYMLLIIELGMIIWSCIILFGQNGIDYKSDNPFYMVVFVYFIMSVISVGVVIVLLPFICCCMLNDSRTDKGNIHNLSSISVIN